MGPNSYPNFAVVIGSTTKQSFRNFVWIFCRVLTTYHARLRIRWNSGLPINFFKIINIVVRHLRSLSISILVLLLVLFQSPVLTLPRTKEVVLSREWPSACEFSPVHNFMLFTLSILIRVKKIMYYYPLQHAVSLAFTRISNKTHDTKT